MTTKELKLIIEQVVEEKIDEYFSEIGMPTKKSMQQKELIEAAIAKKVKEIKKLAGQIGEDPNILLEQAGLPNKSTRRESAFDAIMTTKTNISNRKEPPGAKNRKMSTTDGVAPIKKQITEEDYIIAEKIKNSGFGKFGEPKTLQEQKMFEAMMMTDGDTVNESQAGMPQPVPGIPVV